MMAYISHVSLHPHAEPISVFECQQQIMTRHTARAHFADCYSATQDRDPDRQAQDRLDAAHLASESSSPLLLCGTRRLTPMRGIVRHACPNYRSSTG